MIKKARVHGRERVILFLIFLFSFSCAQAFQIYPMSYTLTPSGDGSRQTLRIENTFRHPVAIEMEVWRRSMDELGQITHMPAEEDFLVFPPQTRLEAGATQAIRVQYIGDPSIAATQAYTIAARQIPVRSPEADAASVQIVFNMGTAAYVRPQGARANLEPATLQPSEDGSSMETKIHNLGNGHVNLHEATWLVKNGDGSEETIDTEIVQSILNNPIIYPGQSRFITLPVENTKATSGAVLNIQLPRRRQ